MRRRLIALLALPLLVPVAGQLPGSAASPAGPGPRLPEQASETAREHAEEALARAEALFAERSPEAARRQLAHGGRDATMVLNQLMRAREDLSPDDKERADALLARPTAEEGDQPFPGITIKYEDGEETPVCSTDPATPICVHYAQGPDSDAPPTADNEPANGIPDAVDRTLALAEQVHSRYLQAGYRRPDPDGGEGGETDMVDIYLADTGAVGLYGYCTSDEDYHGDNGPWNYWAYCVIDEDFAGFPNTPQEDRQVTLAHEYFHAVQFAYDAFEDGWFQEATATWAEDELFDGVNDNRQYLRYGQLRKPRVPLDKAAGGLNVYGNWIFFRYLTERWTASQAGLPTIVREMWRKSSGREGARDMHSTRAVQSALAARNTSFTKVYGQFADANRRPGRTYSEGRQYRASPLAKTWRLRASKRRTGGYYTKLDHLTSSVFRYRPGKGTRQRDWRLRLRVDPPALRTAPVVRVTVYKKNGKISSSAIRLRKRGASTKTLPFSSRGVKYVELVLANASRRSNCWEGTTWACSGIPRDNNERTDFSARIFRR